MPFKHRFYVTEYGNVLHTTVRPCPMIGDQPDLTAAKAQFPGALVNDVSRLGITGHVTVIPVDKPTACYTASLGISKLIAARIALAEGATMELPALPTP